MMPGAVRWGTEFLVNQTLAGVQDTPALTPLQNGRFVVTWSGQSNAPNQTGRDVFARIINADGTPAGDELVVNTVAAGSQVAATAATLVGGRVVVAWTHPDSTGLNINVQIYISDGTPLGGNFPVNTTTAGTQSVPAIAALTNGRFVVAWTDGSGSGDTSGADIRARIFNPGGDAYSSEFRVNLTTTGDQRDVAVAGLPGGGFVAAWGDYSQTGGDQSLSAIRAQVFSDTGAGVGPEFLVNTTTDSYQEAPSITTLSDGRFLVTWHDLHEDEEGEILNAAVRGQVFNASGTPSGSEFLINVATAMTPAVAALPGGRFVVAWTDAGPGEDDASGSSVRGQVFNGDGLRSGSELLVNTTTSNSQFAPTIAVLADGRFTIAWTDASGYGDAPNSATNIRAHIFDPREQGVKLNGTASRDDLVGTDFEDLLSGGEHSDRLIGAGGPDYLAGGNSNDILRGGDGDDVLDGGRSGDVLDGGDGTDTVFYDVPSAIGPLVIDLATPANNTWEAQGDSYVSIENVTAFDGADIVRGNNGNNALLGRGGDDRLEGGGGDDVLDGGVGADAMIGGLGNDLYVVNSAGDVVTEGANEGIDEVRTASSFSLAGLPNVENLTGTGTGKGQALTGNALANVITGGAGNDTIDGGAGADTMIGNGGNDTYIVDHPGDVVIETAGAGIDTVRTATSVFLLPADVENMTYIGSVGFTGTGNDLANIIVGGAFVDRLDGAAGADTLSGGLGNDVFVYVPGSGADVVTDFAAGTGDSDRIDLASFTSITVFADVLARASQTDAGTVIDFGNGDTLTLRDVRRETLTVDDFVLAEPQALPSLVDVLWRHQDRTLATASHELGTASNSWRIAATGDFDADGDGDILWHNRDGRVVTWEMEDGRYRTNHNIASASGGWEIVDAGDFDADGDADVLWRHRDGAVVTWEMENGAFVRNHHVAFASAAWEINGLGDFDADGDADILWRHRDGAVVTWEMEDGTFVRNHNVAFGSTSWEIRGAGDFDGDGDADILWRHRDGMVVSWEMENGSFVTNHHLGVLAPDWQVRGVHDFDSDGDADILWRNDNGAVMTWGMQAGAVLTSRDFGAVSSVWQVVRTGEFDLV
jgi:Ca2+-binding RTX toxin-like protein